MRVGPDGNIFVDALENRSSQFELRIYLVNRCGPFENQAAGEKSRCSGRGRCRSLGGKSLVMAGMLGAKNTSHVSEVFRVVRLALDVLVVDCPCLERDSSALIGEGKPITKAVPTASAKNSRLEDIMVLSDRISLSLFCYFSFH